MILTIQKDGFLRSNSTYTGGVHHAVVVSCCTMVSVLFFSCHTIHARNTYTVNKNKSNTSGTPFLEEEKKYVAFPSHYEVLSAFVLAETKALSTSAFQNSFSLSKIGIIVKVIMKKLRNN